MDLGDLLAQILFKDNIGIDNANSLKDKILDKEQFILNIPSDIGYKGVVSHSITNKHSAYNLIDFGWPEVDIITDKIKQMVEPINFDKENVYVKMWANIYRKGEYINRHSHMLLNRESLMFRGIFSGHCFLYSDIPTSTIFYYGPYQVETNEPNTAGEVDIFSSLVPHEFKAYQGELRVGVAFDLAIGDKAYSKLKNNPNFKKI